LAFSAALFVMLIMALGLPSAVLFVVSTVFAL